MKVAARERDCRADYPERNVPIGHGFTLRVSVQQIGSCNQPSHILFGAGGVCMYRATTIAATLFALSAASAAVDDPVKLDTGMVSGAATTSPDVRVFKGIPFAAAP